MKIALDTHPLYTTRAGTARHVRGLLEGLSEACPEVEVLPVVWPVENLDYSFPGRWWRSFYRELVWARGAGPWQLADSGAALLHSPALPLFAPRKLPHVVTLHDLAILRQPGRFRRWQRYRARARLELVQRADRVVCVSRFTADEAMRLLGLPSSRLVVVPNGVRVPLAGSGAALRLPPDFFLFVGSLEPGKNLGLLRQVWELAAQHGVRLPPLLIAGARWAGVTREGPPPATWRYLGEVSDEDLGALYRAARALLFPSLYEGFGLPVAEAQAAGCPVVCAPVASLPEVAGAAALYAPHEAAAWLAALRRLLADEALASALRVQGPVQARQFTWRRMAEETLAVWRDVLRC